MDPAPPGTPRFSRLQGTQPPRSQYWLTRFVLLRLLGFIYLIAFLVAANQLIPLVGQNGLTPADPYVQWMLRKAGSPGQAFWHWPTLFLWAGATDTALLAVSWTGVALSAVVLLGFANSLLMALLWALYMSIVHVGQEWYAFGWESQLLETGFLAIFLCPLLDPRPFPRLAPPVAVLWLYRWLIFRIMIGAGLIKMRGDPCWRDLTALYCHYETQPLPNPLSRVLHFMPHWFHNLECLWNHFIELVVPWFAFWPAVTRRVAGILFVMFQGTLILSGNLSFLNWLTIIPALACIDDAIWRRVLPRWIVSRADCAAGKSAESTPQLVCAGLLCVLVGWLSIDPVLNLCSPHQVMNRQFEPFGIVNTYGAFGSVTKERYELIVEGTDDQEVTPATRWREYEFKAKPGDPTRRLPIVAPYHYRLDWVIWFVPFSDDVEENPWVFHFLWKLLHNDPGTLSLLANNPFPSAPPKHVRVELYRYRFSPPGSGAPWRREWTRTLVPPVSTGTPWFVRLLEAHGWRKPGGK